ncbi:Endoribonuclease Dicer like 1 [Apostasia shenzhenica]|uniref:Endoribonuclease Dicer homolog 1 n=1 Tax=Apostasia shenzhenica TaxID=1088818 RepID=A0A2H9ZTG1_9ASPA|nr:Endoribonuclease Dicer like 1 [Apostasia shenzhenica]
MPAEAALSSAAGTGDGTPASYWVDALEDGDALSGIEFADYDPSVLPISLDQAAVDDGFISEIDRILESINGDQPVAPPAMAVLQHLPPPAMPAGETANTPKLEEFVPGAQAGSSENGSATVKRQLGARPAISDGNVVNGDGRYGKRARVGGYRAEERSYPPARHERYGEPPPSRRWARDWDEKKRREGERGRKRERDDGEFRDGERREREIKGYWERDHRSGRLVFRVGSWDNEANRETKKAKYDSMEQGKGSPEKKDEVKKDKPAEEQARQYQLEVLEQAKKKNTIAFLETGAGKTLIAVLLMKSLCAEMMKEHRKMLAIFLVPKVPLVYQQAEVIRERTGFRVGHYCGEMGQDFWDARRWHREFESKQVLVMTAQILLNILRHSIIKMESVHLLILDECHHAVKKHPYSLVMSEFYHTTSKEKRPAVFGMTASPVNLKGVSSQEDCAIKIRNLESKLDSIVCTVKDRRELEKHVPTPLETVVHYDKAATLWSLHEQIKQMEAAVEEAARSSSRRSKWQFMGARDAGCKEELRLVYGVSERTESDGAANLIQKLRAINYSLAELGQWCAYMVANSFLAALQNDERTNYQLDVKFQETYLKKVVALLQCHLSEGAVSSKGSESSDANISDSHSMDEIEEGELLNSHAVSSGEHVDEIIGAAVADGKVTPKVQSLIKILLKYQHTEDFRAIIFVERVVAALVLPKVFSELPSLGFIRCASLIGHNNNQEMRSGQMQETIAKFRDGRVTLLVATSVAEEGLDIRQCNVVMRFDLAKTVLAYIQSRGRARKPGSDYILMLERGNLSHETFLRNARNSEETLRKEALERTDISHLKGNPRLTSVEAAPGSLYQVESTGALVSLNSAVGLIHFYCSQLPSDRYSLLRPEFIMERHERPGGLTEYSCKLQLPCNAAFERLDGPPCSSMRLAQQAVCLAACKKLHEMGAFTDALLPDKGVGEDGENIEQNDEVDSLVGTARHREFYPEGVAEILQGEWILSGRDGCQDSAVFQLYMYAIKSVNIGSSKDPFLSQVSDFAILFGNELDAEVLSMTMDLFVARMIITKASLIYRGPVKITGSQLVSLKSFHVRLMSIVLDVDVDPATTPWDTAKAYLFVPIITEKHVDAVKEINWSLVESIVSSDAWASPLQRARPDVYLGTNERTLGGDRREYGYGKLRHGMAFGLKPHPTYGIRGAVAQFDVVKASGLVSAQPSLECHDGKYSFNGKLFMADCCIALQDLVGKIVTAAHSGKRFYVDSVHTDMNAENSFPRKEGYLGPLEYSSYADYYRQKYGVDLMYKKQPLIRARGVSYCKNLLSPRFEHNEARDGESDESLDKTYYVFLPPELCLIHPLPGTLVRGAQRLPSIMKRVESMLLAIELKARIDYPVPAAKILEALTAASCQETVCYERAELLGDAYLKWVVSRFLFLKYPQKHEGQLTRMRQQMVSNMVLYQYALCKGLQSYIQADRFSPSRWASPGVLPVFDEDTKESESSLFGEECPAHITEQQKYSYDDDDDAVENCREDGEIEADSSCYRVLSSKTLADVVEALIGVYYVDGGKNAANHLMRWIGIHVEFDPFELESVKPHAVPESIMRSVDFDALESALNVKFKDRALLVEAITHASRPSSGVSCYQRLEFVGDAVLDHLITRHLFFTYTDLPPGRLTDLRAAAVNNENFARVAVKHKLHVHLRHGSSALESQIRDFVKDVREELSKPGFNSFGLGDCKAPKVLGDIVESVAGAIYLDNGLDTLVVWKVFQPLLQPMVTPETLPMHPVRELQERCQQQAEGLEYKASRAGNLATVEVFVDGVQIGVAQNPQKKMAQKLAARNALVVLKEKEEKERIEKDKESALKKDGNNGEKNNNGQIFTRQALNDICLRRQWPMPQYRCVNEGGPAHAKRFIYAVRVNTSDRGWTDECIGEPMPSVKKAKDSAAVLLLELLKQVYPETK